MEHNETIIKEIEEYCLSRSGAYETRPFGKYPICYRIMGKIFAQFNPEERFYKITLKCDPEKAAVYRQLYPGIVVYRKGEPVACGAFKMYDEDHAELKRIFTETSCRNIGLGSELVRRLEAKAKIKGYGRCILETGKILEAACHIYKKAGYKIIPNYGQYADMPDSVCMERKI